MTHKNKSFSCFHKRFIRVTGNTLKNTFKHPANCGFTLLELLIVVLVIAVLVAVAVPLYKHAVLKSRFSTIMPVVKNVADAQEVYYLGNNYYAESMDLLDITPPAPQEVILSVSTGQQYEGYNYVMARHVGVPNAHYVIYQDKSANFPAERHCEASKTDPQTLWLCSKGLNGTRISGSLTPDYQTYVLEGQGKGTSYSVATMIAGVSCDASENSGNKSCTVDNTSSTEYVTKTVCTDKTNSNTCTYHIYNRDAKHWECPASNSNLVDGVCVPTAKGTYARQYDEDGNRVELQCDTYNTNADVCNKWAERTYDPTSTKVRADQRDCLQWDSNGLCTEYKQNTGYDSFGTLTSPSSFDKSLETRTGNDVNWDYAGHTTNWAQLNCAEISNDGICTSYKDGWYDTVVWNENKKGTFAERVQCSKVTPQGECETVSQYQTIAATYTDSNKVETLIYRACLAKDAAGNCTSYKQNDRNANYQESYGYDAKGNQTSYVRYRCNALDSATECTTYATSLFWDKTYNASNKMLSQVQLGCTSYDSNNNCVQRSSDTNTYNTYAANGTTQTSQITTKCNTYTGLECTGGWTVTTIPYVNGKADNNHKVTNSHCVTVDMATGVCLDE